MHINCITRSLLLNSNGLVFLINYHIKIVALKIINEKDLEIEKIPNI